jgi:hypothetical protein
MLELLEGLGSIESLGWAGTIVASVGALLLALNCHCSQYGFVCGLLSSACLIAYAVLKSAMPILVLNVVMMLISVVGLLNWFGRKARMKRWLYVNFDALRYQRMVENARARQGL